MNNPDKSVTKEEMVELLSGLEQRFNTKIKSEIEEFAFIAKNNFDRMDIRFEQVDSRFEQMDKRFEQVDKRFEQIDRRFEQVDEHFERIDRKLQGIDQRFDTVTDIITADRKSSRQKFRALGVA